MASHIAITPLAGAVRVSVGELVLGESRAALELREGSYPAVIYVPRGDIDMDKLRRTDRATSCPWKGPASNYTISTPGGELETAVWSYETPLPDMAQIAGHLAFYPNKVTVTRF